MNPSSRNPGSAPGFRTYKTSDLHVASNHKKTVPSDQKQQKPTDLLLDNIQNQASSIKTHKTQELITVNSLLRHSL